jgi:hypothetical protein
MARMICYLPKIFKLALENVSADPCSYPLKFTRVSVHVYG